MESFIMIVAIVYIIINIVSCCMYSCSNDDFLDFLVWHTFFGLVGLPGTILGVLFRKLVQKSKMQQLEADNIKRKEEEKRIQERERTIRANKDKEIQEQLEIRALQIEQSQMFKNLLSFILEAEIPYRIDVESERVIVYLNGKTKTFDFLLNGIEKIFIPMYDKDSRDTDLYALAYTINKNMKENFELQPATKVYESCDEFFQQTIKVTLKRKLQTIV